MVSVHRPVHLKITVTCTLTWQTGRWQALYTPENDFQSVTKRQGGLFLSIAQAFSALIRINCQNEVSTIARLRVLSIMPLQAWAHRWSTYPQLSPLYPLYHSCDKIYQALSSLVPSHQIFRARPAALPKNRVWTPSQVNILGHNYTSIVSCCRTNQIAQVK